MILLLLFALVAGAGTGVTPCVLPILPALLSAGATGGRRRPLGIALGLVVTFTIAIVAVASVVKGVGLGTGAVRDFAIFVLIGFGISLLVPAIGARIEAPLSRLARFGPKSRGDGFWSGLGVGGALGFVCAPCAGPILGAVVSVSASRGTSAQLVAVALAYAVGLGAVLLALSLGGRLIVERIRRAGRGFGFQRAVGGVLVATGVLMAFNLDVRFETALANHFPGFLTNPTGSLESSHAVQSRLASATGSSARFATADTASASASTATAGLPGVKTPKLPVYGRAPEFVGTQRWFNTPGGRPLALAGLRGHPVLIDFWTYTCVNCIRTFPFLRAIYAKYHRDGLQIVGVHTPEFPFEHNASNVAAAIKQNGLRYPVVQDNGYATWNAWGNQFWPASYLIDARGNVRYAHFGEGNEQRTEAAIRTVLAQSGAQDLGGGAHPKVEVPSALATPETYLDSTRSRGWVPGGRNHKGVRTYVPVTKPPALSHFALSGRWRITAEGGTALRGGQIHATVQGKKVYLVLSPKAPGVAQRLHVLLDGKPIPAAAAGSDVHDGVVTVRRQRLYNLVAFPRSERTTLTLSLDPGVQAFAFTFG